MPDQTEIDSEKKFQEPLKNRWEVISKLDKIAEKAGLKNINWERPISKASKINMQWNFSPQCQVG